MKNQKGYFKILFSTPKGFYQNIKNPHGVSGQSSKSVLLIFLSQFLQSKSELKFQVLHFLHFLLAKQFKIRALATAKCLHFISTTTSSTATLALPMAFVQLYRKRISELYSLFNKSSRNCVDNYRLNIFFWTVGILE